MIELFQNFDENDAFMTQVIVCSTNGTEITIKEHPVIRSFTKMVYDDGWIVESFDWMKWDYRNELITNPGKISNCDLDAICKLITSIVRAERFCDGTLMSAYRKGVFDAIIKRLKEL